MLNNAVLGFVFCYIALLLLLLYVVVVGVFCKLYLV